MGLLANTIRLMRPVDWVKNIFVLPAIIFSESLSEPDAILNTAIAFCAFCLLSSGFYALNDVADAASDRIGCIRLSEKDLLLVVISHPARHLLLQQCVQQVVLHWAFL